MRNVILVGGAESQCLAIRIVQKLGYRAIVVDGDVNCKGIYYADAFYNISTAEVQEIEKLARKLDAIAVLAVQSDLGMLTAAMVSKNLGLKNISLEVAKLFTNKIEMREFLKANNFAHPRFKLCKNREELDLFSKEIGYPYVIKPIDSQGSRGVNIIWDEQHAINIKEVQKFNRDDEGIICEEFLGNDEYTVEGITIARKHYVLGISQKTHYKSLECVSQQLFYSWEAEYEFLEDQHNSLIEKTGMDFGITHAEYIKNEQGYVLVEFAARGGGSMISSHIIPAISNWNVEEMYIKEILNIPYEIPEKKKKCAVLKFIELETSRRIRKIDGLDYINNHGNVIYISLLYQEEEVVQPVTNDTNRHGYYIAWATNKNELYNIMHDVEDSLRIEYYD